MTELTIDMAMDIANKTSYKDWVKHFRPDWTDDECDFYLWEHTCFPFAFKEVIKQLNEQLLNKHTHENNNLNFNGAAIISGNIPGTKKTAKTKSH